eukprot:scaffold25258_cov101-Isochrysis_galbana.AAC.3
MHRLGEDDERLALRGVEPEDTGKVAGPVETGVVPSVAVTYRGHVHLTGSIGDGWGVGGGWFPDTAAAGRARARL